MKPWRGLAAGLAALMSVLGTTEAETTPSAPAAPDWANLGRYQADNSALGLPAAGESRVVFIGASTIENWGRLDPGFFAGNPGYINRGISGQTTPQLLVRFRQDVLELKPAVVFILCGLNDIAGNTGPITAQQTLGNLTSMVELAQANGVKVVLGALLPANRIGWAPQVTNAAQRVAEINALLAAYTTEKNVPFVDFGPTLGDALGGLKPDYSDDGVHLKAGIYQLIDEQAKAAIAAALAS